MPKELPAVAYSPDRGIAVLAQWSSLQLPTKLGVEFLENIDGRTSTELDFSECKWVFKKLCR